MSIINILLPDFAMILLGLILHRQTNWGEAFWDGLEKLVYYVLFPALLFYSTARAPLDFATAGVSLQVTLAALSCGIALAWLAKPMFKAGPMLFESAMQTAFRFNSYLALALAFRLGGETGAALMALIMGFTIPVANMAAVHALVHKSGGLLQGLIRNPLLMATAGGIIFNLAGLQLPDIAAVILSRIGNASIALGLLLVGAGLRLSGLNQAKGMAAYFILVKLVIYPTIGLLLARWAGLTGLQLQLTVIYCALPTAASAYVLAARMGGNGPFVAFIVSTGTVLSILTLPVWLVLAR